MSSEVNLDSIDSDALFHFMNWTLETGLWNGRSITWKEAPQFYSEMEQRVAALLFSEDFEDTEFEEMLAWLGTPRENRSLLARDMEQLALSPDGVVVLLAKHHHHHKKHKHHHHHHKKSGMSKLWKEHKTEILIGAGFLLLLTVVVIVTACSAGTAAGGALAGGAALNKLNEGDSEKKDRPPSNDSAKPPPSPAPEPIALPKEEPPAATVPQLPSNAPGMPVFFENGLLVNGEFFNYSAVLQGISEGTLLSSYPGSGFSSYSPEQRPEEIPPSSLPQEAPPSAPPSDLSKMPFPSFSASLFSINGSARDYGSHFAHRTLDTFVELGEIFPQVVEEVKRIWPECLTLEGPEIRAQESYDELVAIAHQKIDELFATDQAKYYTPEAKAKARANDPCVYAVLPLPSAFSKGIDVSKFRKIVQGTQQTAAFAEQLGLSSYEIAELEAAGKLEQTVASAFEGIVTDRARLESIQKFRKAEDFFKQYRNPSLTEAEARELIHQFGIKTFPKPQGIPESFRIEISDKGAGIKYVHPENTHTYIRVMPGKPHSPFPYQQNPYVVQMKDGKTLDKFGNVVHKKSPEAHIPLEEFIFKIE